MYDPPAAKGLVRLVRPGVVAFGLAGLQELLPRFRKLDLDALASQPARTIVIWLGSLADTRLRELTETGPDVMVVSGSVAMPR